MEQGLSSHLWISTLRHMLLVIMTMYKVLKFYKERISSLYLQVLDTSGAQLIKKCGSTVPSKIISSGNKLIVKFHSDSSVTLKGFRATWKTVTATEGGNIKSPNYPSNYPDNKVQVKFSQIQGSFPVVSHENNSRFTTFKIFSLSS